MDSGFLGPGETLEDDYDVMRRLLPEEVLGIMDQLLCCEMAWHQGYPLSQTIFTSHYIDKVINTAGVDIASARFRPNDTAPKDLLVDLVLHSYCLGLIKSCDLVIQKITSTHFYEEEDFSTHTYGRDLLPEISSTETQNYLQTAIEVVEKECPSIEPTKVWAAIRARLLLRSLLLGVMSPDGGPSSEDWAALSSILAIVKDTYSLSQPVPSSFSPKIQRRLASTVPPRPIVELSFDDAHGTLSRLCRDCHEATRIIDIQPESAEQLKSLLWSFSSRTPEPLPYARAYLSAPILSCDDQGFEQLLRTDLAELVLPADAVLDPANWTFEPPQSASAIPDPRFEIANTISNFTASVVTMMGGYLEFFRALCSNRCRLRRNLTHIAQGLENAQQELTDNLDVVLGKSSADTIPRPLETWVEHQKIRIMEWVVLLGFELDIYLPDEYAGMYWYLSRLADHRARILESLSALQSERYNAIKSRRMHAKQAAEIERSITFIISLLHEARGTTALASALYQMYTCLSYQGSIPQAARNSKYRDPKIQYEIRFKYFLTIEDPKLPPFEEFERALSPYGSFESPNIDRERIVISSVDTIEASAKDARGNFAALKRMGIEKALCTGVEDWEKVCPELLYPTFVVSLTNNLEYCRNACLEYRSRAHQRNAKEREREEKLGHPYSTTANDGKQASRLVGCAQDP